MDSKCSRLGGINSYNEKAGTAAVEVCCDGYNLISFISGRGEVFIEGSLYSVEEGAVLLIKPLSYFRISSSDSLKYTRIEFFDAAVSDMARNILECITEHSSFGILHRKLDLWSSLSNIVKAISGARKLPEIIRGEYASGLLHSALAIIASSSGEHLFAGGEDLGSRLRAYINDNITDDLSLEGLEKVFFVSKYYLCRAFKQRSGVSIHSYVTRKRIALAASLIENGELAGTVAYKVGFGDYSAFYRAFVKYTGYSPMGS